jgi:hypothetical protein
MCFSHFYFCPFATQIADVIKWKILKKKNLLLPILRTCTMAAVRANPALYRRVNAATPKHNCLPYVCPKIPLYILKKHKTKLKIKEEKNR